VHRAPALQIDDANHPQRATSMKGARLYVLTKNTKAAMV
jgi:hypothetical protein